MKPEPLTPRFLLLLAISFLAAPSLAAQNSLASAIPAAAQPRAPEGELPAPPDRPATKKLLAEKSHVLAYAVTRSEDGKWIRLAAEIEAAFPVRASTIIGIVQNYVNAPKVFSRIDWVKIVDRLENGAITEQFSGVKTFGIKFYTTNRFHQWTSLDGDYTVLHFAQVESGGSLRNCGGGWAVADRSTGDEPLCYVLYSLSLEALDKFPGQEAIMRGFGEADVIRALAELGAAATKGTETP